MDNGKCVYIYYKPPIRGGGDGGTRAIFSPPGGEGWFFAKALGHSRGGRRFARHRPVFAREAVRRRAGTPATSANTAAAADDGF